MVENSETSAPSDRRRTRSTVKLTQEEALQVLQSAAAMCQDSGLTVQRTTLYERGVSMAAIIISGASWQDNNLVCTTTGKGGE